MDKITLMIYRVLTLLIFIGILWIIVTVAFVAYNEGVLSVLQDTFGKWINCVMILMCLVCFSSVIWLRFLVKKERYVYITAYLLVIIFSLLTFALINIGDRKFSEFSVDKWAKYPERRITMYFDLIERYDVIGSSQTEVIELLGEPSEVTNYNTFIYSDRYGNEIYIEFKDKRVVDIRLVE